MSNEVKLDVRPLLATGQEPFAKIMEVVAQLLPGQTLTLIAPFKPTPLLDVMSRRGFASRSGLNPDGSWSVKFMPRPNRDLMVSPGANDVANWPNPARLIDLSRHDSATAIPIVEEIVAGLSSSEIAYMFLAEPPGDWLGRFTHAGHRWAWSYDDVLEGFGLMISGAKEENPTIQ
ncbi:DUF2249 domain-containing protein [Pelagibacterium flavum]|uniref:DUF2249 domain-containing protein n=1 Tax=Pelagibacterium flavum TaxID=2984530 RepID=A0ABY6IPW3_9HYPH|nr:DUF2249 domain-containing protein [Pelagibacterium sp. YIM 151497]UYQ72636.1 DUF2249 domain-containing protein [Pelagibacterium sp. YIM 151497]